MKVFYKLLPQLISLILLSFIFEEFLLGRINASQQIYLIWKLLTEVVLYLVLMTVLVERALVGKLGQYKLNKVDVFLFLFLFIAILSTVINRGSLLEVIIKCRTMFRYMAIYYIIVLSDWLPSTKSLFKFIKFILMLAVLQSLIVVLQHIMGGEFMHRFFSPPSFSSEETLFGTISTAAVGKLGAGYGTFGKTATLAYFQLIAIVLLIVMLFNNFIFPKKKVIYWMVFGLILIGIFYSYKRSVLLLALVVPFLAGYFLKLKKVRFSYYAAGCLLLPVLLMVIATSNVTYVKAKEVELTPVQAFAQLFTSKYWEVAADKQRGWMIVEVGKQAFASFKPIGYGGDEQHTKNKLAEKGGEFSKLVDFGAFDDVYIIANLLYFGPVGLMFLLIIFYNIYKINKRLVSSQLGFYTIVPAANLVLLVLIFLSSFIVRVIEFRAFIFIFWVLCGISIVLSNRQKLIIKNR